MADRYEDRYRGDERGWREDRGFTERAGDEIRSWFGDEEAERRRRMDERERGYERARWREHDRYPGQQWGGSPSRDYGSRAESEGRWGSEGGWRSGAGSTSWNSDRGRADYRPSSRGWTQPEYGSSGYGSYRGESDRFGAGESQRHEYSSEPFGRPYGARAWWETGRSGEFTGRGPKGYQRSDSRINEDVCDRLADAPDIDASGIEVKTSNGEVTLSGSVTDRYQKRRAEDLVEHISGVREVHNTLRVSRWQEGASGTTHGTPGGSTSGTATGGTRR